MLGVLVASFADGRFRIVAWRKEFPNNKLPFDLTGFVRAANGPSFSNVGVQPYAINPEAAKRAERRESQ